MRVILSHNNLDFDALASLALARLLHTGATVVALGGYEDQVRAFERLYRQHLELVDASEIELDEITELIVVDTADPKRIAPFDTLVERVPVTVYDHHPKVELSIPAKGGLCRQVGATATILTLLLKGRSIPIPPEVASLGLLGIHEDTGNLSYALTTPDDYEAAAHLLRSGGQLALVREFSREHYTAEQRGVLQELLGSAEEHRIKHHRVVVARYKSQDYVSGISPLSNRLMDFFDADAVLIAASMGERSLLIARAKAGTIDVGAALEVLGGGGHAVAAFARTTLALEEAIKRSLKAFAAHARQPVTAADLMSRPVVTVAEKATIREARAKLERFGYSGLPVVDEGGRLVGIISRRDIDKALRHGLAGVGVKGFMNRVLVTATEATPQRDLAKMVQEHNVGRVPVMAGNKVVGIVTRSDLLRAMHKDERRAYGSEEDELAWQVLGSLPTSAARVLEEVQRYLTGGTLYLVGGTVRDALLKIGMQDLDLVIEGDSAERLGSALQSSLGGSLSCHFDFGTCNLRLPGGLNVDIATAREEYYRHPGALPEVSPSDLLRDLARRDFTLNALALRITPGPPGLIDPFKGLQDLKDKLLRSLHPLSFIEDPTRILRGARLCARLGLSFHPDTRAQVPAALEPEVLRQVSKSRLRQELMLCCAERQVLPVLQELEALGALGAMFAAELEPDIIAALDSLRQETEVPDEAYLLALLLTLTPAALEKSAQTYFWPRRLLEAVTILRQARSSGSIQEAALGALEPAAQVLLGVLSPALAAQLEQLLEHAQRQRLRGRDVLDLGLEQGPGVGKVLAEIAKARADGRATSFEEELALAKKLVGDRKGAS